MNEREQPKPAGKPPQHLDLQSRELTVCIDFKSVECYLTLPLVQSIATESKHLRLRLLPFLVRGPDYGRNSTKPDKQLHLQQKNAYSRRMWRYEASTPQINLPLHLPSFELLNCLDTEPLLAGLLYLNEIGKQIEDQTRYALAVFQQIFCTSTDDHAMKRLDVTDIDHMIQSTTGAHGYLEWYALEDRCELVRICTKKFVDDHQIFAVPSFLYGGGKGGEGGEGGEGNNMLLHNNNEWIDEKYLQRCSRELFSFRWSSHLLRQRLICGGHLQESSVQRKRKKEKDGGEGGGSIPGKLFSVDCFVDIKSPYAYLALAPLRELREEYPTVAFQFLPFPLDIPSYLGYSKNKAEDKIQSKRSSVQWRAVRYAYADIRRRHRVRELMSGAPKKILFGTSKIWNTWLESSVLMFVQKKRPDLVDAYMDATWSMFWRRELDVENKDALLEVLRMVGVDDVLDFEEFVQGEGREIVASTRRKAWEDGCFGVPTMIVSSTKDGKIIRPSPFWGSEHFNALRDLLNTLVGVEDEKVGGVARKASSLLSKM